MANPLLNRVDTTLTEQTIQDIQQQLNAIEQQLPFLLEVTPEEAKHLPKIDVSNHDFVRETISVLDTEPIMLPQGFSAEAVKRDYELYNQLDTLTLRFEQLFKLLSNTRMVAGSEAYQSSLFIYKLVQAYAGAGIPGYGALNDRLKTRFLGQGSSEKTETTTNDAAE